MSLRRRLAVLEDAPLLARMNRELIEDEGGRRSRFQGRPAA
jgi:hypothetical protein